MDALELQGAADFGAITRRLTACHTSTPEIGLVTSRGRRDCASLPKGHELQRRDRVAVVCVGQIVRTAANREGAVQVLEIGSVAAAWAHRQADHSAKHLVATRAHMAVVVSGDEQERYDHLSR